MNHVQDKAVSPIIATILLIAITVTLAASFYSLAVPYFSQTQQFTPEATLVMHNSTIYSGGRPSPRYTVYISNMPQKLSASGVTISIRTENYSEININLMAIQNGVSENVSGTNITLQSYPDTGYMQSGEFIVLQENGSLPLASLVFVDSYTSGTIASLDL